MAKLMVKPMRLDSERAKQMGKQTGIRKERLKVKLKRLEIEMDWRWEILMDLLMHLGFGKVKRMEKRSAKQRLMEIG